MATEVLSVTSEDRDGNSIKRAAQILRQGGLVGIPTETVYGVAASAECDEAVDRLRKLKGRGRQSPLTVHIGDHRRVTDFVTPLPKIGQRLVERGWPGPLTLVFDVQEPLQAPVMRDKPAVLAEVIYYSGSVGLRCPDHPVCREVIEQADCLVVASSANRSGEAAPITAEATLAALDGMVDLVLDAGPTRYAGPSTIVRLREHRLQILRHGVLDERTVRRLAMLQILVVCTGNTCRSPMAEGLLKAQLAKALGCRLSELEDQGYRVMSAGTAALDGTSATPEAIGVLKEKGADIDQHRAQLLTAEAIEDAQVILVMTEGHRQRVIDLAPEAETRTHLIAGRANIEDPLGGSPEVYRDCCDKIEAGLESRLTEIIL